MCAWLAPISSYRPLLSSFISRSDGIAVVLVLFGYDVLA
jgi:hypothetical protein